MRRGLSIFLLSILFFSALAMAEEDSSKEDLDDISGKSKTTKAIEKEISVPTKLQIPARIIFGIKDTETMSIERLIVLFAIWLVFFLVMIDILKFSSFGDEVRWVVSFSMVVIMAVTGVINSLSLFAFGLGNSIKWMENLGALRIFLVIIVAAAIMFGARLLTSKIKEKRLLEKAKDKGAAAGRFAAGAEKFEEEILRE
jgi:hypothetical protein